MRSFEQITGTERYFGIDEIIVSKTDTGGRITYANDVFLRVSGFEEHEVLNQPHSMIRHPDMPRCIFKLLWDTLKAESEIFAYVVNRCKNGDHYWVLAHVTPTFDQHGQVIGYHSNRRVPSKESIRQISALYKTLNEEEQRFDRSMEGMGKSHQLLESVLAQQKLAYDEFVFSMTQN